MQRYFATDKIGEDIILSNDDIHHIKRVMRMKNNDIIEVVFNNILYKVEITNIDNMDLKVLEIIDQKDDKYPDIILIIPSLKEQKMDLILQKCTEIGVSKIIIAPFERSIVKLDERKEKVKLERWKKICKEASEQSMRVNIPLITMENNLNFVEQLNGLKLICSTNEKENYIKSVLKNHSECDKITLVIGPEGGISSKEEAYYESKGFKKITLGTQIMRVETVPIFLTSIIRYEYME